MSTPFDFDVISGPSEPRKDREPMRDAPAHSSPHSDADAPGVAETAMPPSPWSAWHK